MDDLYPLLSTMFAVEVQKERFETFLTSFNSSFTSVICKPGGGLSGRHQMMMYSSLTGSAKNMIIPFLYA